MKITDTYITSTEMVYGDGAPDASQVKYSLTRNMVNRVLMERATGNPPYRLVLSSELFGCVLDDEFLSDKRFVIDIITRKDGVEPLDYAVLQCRDEVFRIHYRRIVPFNFPMAST